MDTREVLRDAFGRIQQVAHKAAEGLDDDALSFRPDPEANSIAWLIWHFTRLQDDHVSHVAGREQAWTADGWHDRFGLPFDPADFGYGHTSDQVAQVRADAGTLLGYLDAVTERTLSYLGGIDADELDRVVDTSYDPPVTVGVRLVSVLSDNLQHAGQARYVRGIAERQG